MPSTDVTPPKDAPVKEPEKVGAPPTNAQTEGNSMVKPPESQIAKPSSLPEASVEGDMTKITDETQFRQEAQRQIARLKNGEPVNFVIDSRNSVHMTKDGVPTSTTQAKMLAEELAKAYPERSFTFSKSYSEAPSTTVAKDGTRLSSSDNTMTLASDTKVNGVDLPAGTKFSNGSLLVDGKLSTIDPEGKVWATKPDGTVVAVTNKPGEKVDLSTDSLVKEGKGTGQILSQYKVSNPGQPNETRDQMLILARKGKGTTPDGRPVVDSYPIAGNDLKGAWEEKSPGLWATKEKKAFHFKMEGLKLNIDSTTDYGQVFPSGAKSDYYMDSGFPDSKEATALNYSRKDGISEDSAREITRIRQEQSMEAAPVAEPVFKPSEEFKPAETGSRQQADAAAVEQTLSPAEKAAVSKPLAVRTPEERASAEEVAKKLGVSVEQLEQARESESRRGGAALALIAILSAAIALAASEAQARERNRQNPTTMGN